MSTVLVRSQTSSEHFRISLIPANSSLTDEGFKIIAALFLPTASLWVACFDRNREPFFPFYLCLGKRRHINESPDTVRKPEIWLQK